MNEADRQQDAGTPSGIASTLSVARIFKAFGYSLKGLRHAIRFEAAFRQELLFAVPALALLPFLRLTPVERVVLVAVTLLVLIVELLNSAIEAAIDRISTERHPLSGRAKDLGSAAVLLSLVIMIGAWITIAGPAIAAWLK